MIDHRPLMLTPLAPIHIGSGDDLDWTRAIPVGGELVVFDPLRVELPDSALSSLRKAAMERDAATAIIQMQRLFRAHQGALEAGAISRIALSRAVKERFEGVFGKNAQTQGTDRVVNAIQLARITTNPLDGRPLIPGTSLKGALRTAEVARRDRPANPRPLPGPRPKREKDGELADQLLGGFGNSPFSRLMVSDLLAGAPVRSLAARVQNERRRYKGDQKDKGVVVTVELLPPGQPGLFRGDIRASSARGSNDRLPPLGINALMTTTHQYHHGLFQMFAQVLGQERRGLHDNWLGGMQRLLRALAPALESGEAALVRLGKFCSAESKTVAWRRVRNAQAKKDVLAPSTLWLAETGNGRLPLGWALLELGETPSQAVQDFCAEMGWQATGDAGSDARPADAVAPARIVPDRSTPARQRMAMLEDGYDQGKSNDPLLEKAIKECAGWSRDDRLLLARLVRDKARLKNKLPAFKWREFEKLLLPLE